MKLILIAILATLSLCGSASSQEIELNIGNNKVTATIASDAASREYGLMNTSQLCTNCGMLFVMPQVGVFSFWMKDTLIPLSIAFVSSDGVIVNLDEMQPNTLNYHTSKGDILYALEMNKGWFAKNSVNTFDRIEGLQQVFRDLQQ